MDETTPIQHANKDNAIVKAKPEENSGKEDEERLKAIQLKILEKAAELLRSASAISVVYPNEPLYKQRTMTDADYVDGNSRTIIAVHNNGFGRKDELCVSILNNASPKNSQSIDNLGRTLVGSEHSEAEIVITRMRQGLVDMAKGIGKYFVLAISKTDDSITGKISLRGESHQNDPTPHKTKNLVQRWNDGSGQLLQRTLYVTLGRTTELSIKDFEDILQALSTAKTDATATRKIVDNEKHMKLARVSTVEKPMLANNTGKELPS